MKFLCDEMLAGLGRWLRAAGYDTAITETQTEDSKILERAIREKRLLLTRDHHFQTMISDGKTVIFLNQNTLEECVHELKRQLNIDWLHDPFSRCLECNAALVKPKPEAVLEQVPESIRSATDRFWYCPHCEKVYWKGSHTERMLEQLKTWNL